MKTIKLITAATFAMMFMAASAFSSEETQAKCCLDAKEAGKECTHPCCVDAAKEGKVCEKCSPEKES
jgi:hypothetical protein